MTRSKLFLLPVLGLSLAYRLVGRAVPTLGDLSAKVLPSVVSLGIRLPDGRTASGVGFLTLQDGILATAWSLVGEALGVVARFPSGEEFECSGVVDKDPKRASPWSGSRSSDVRLEDGPGRAGPGTPVVVAAVKEGAFGLLAAAIGEAAVIDGVRLVRLSGDIPLGRSAVRLSTPRATSSGSSRLGMSTASRRRSSCRPLFSSDWIPRSRRSRGAGRSPAEEAAAKPALSNDEIDVRLGEALLALIDNSVALTHARVVTRDSASAGAFLSFSTICSRAWNRR